MIPNSSINHSTIFNTIMINGIPKNSPKTNFNIVHITSIVI